MPAGNLPASTLKCKNSVPKQFFLSTQLCKWTWALVTSAVCKLNHHVGPVARCHLTTFIWTFWKTLTNIYSGNSNNILAKREKGKAFAVIFRWTWIVTIVTADATQGLPRSDDRKGARKVVIRECWRGEQSAEWTCNCRKKGRDGHEGRRGV